MSEINDKIDSLYEELKDRLNSYNYYDADGYSNREIFKYEESVNIFFDSIISQIKKLCSDYILNNDDMYKYTYLISDSELKKNIIIDFTIVDDNIKYDKNIFKNEINYLLSDIDSFVYNRAKTIREEFYKQLQ